MYCHGECKGAEYKFIEPCPENCPIETFEQSNDAAQNKQYADLQHELNRLRAVLTEETTSLHLISTEAELFPDPVDRAAAEHEIGVALSVKMFAIEKLRRIEQALKSLDTHSYGTCSRCGHDIPSARLKVQPDSRYCVPCLTIVEQERVRH
jgi:DnaK suppressor protein